MPRKLSKGFHLLIFLMAMPCAAFAGPKEQEIMTEDVTPEIVKAQQAFQAACGCGLKINVDMNKGPMNSNDLYSAKHFAEDITESVTTFCVNARSKTLMCKMTTLNIVKAPKEDVAATVSGGTVTASVNGGWHNDMKSVGAALGNR
jgi:hypothetical protein